MSELVTITPQAGFNALNDPEPAGLPFDVTALEVAPGNTLQRWGVGGDLDSVDFTVFLPLRMRVQVRGERVWQPVMPKLVGSFTVHVRSRNCVGRAQEWNSGGVGGIAVLCHSSTGTAQR